jgi:hypothetical protein
MDAAITAKARVGIEAENRCPQRPLDVTGDDKRRRWRGDMEQSLERLAGIVAA